MSKFLFFVLVLLGIHFDASAQFFNAAQKFLLPLGLLSAIDQNQQQLNPAASHPQEIKGLHFYTSAPLQIPNLNAAQLSIFYAYSQFAIYHELSGVFHPSNQQFQTTHALAFSPYPGLHIGLGLQLQLFTQPAYYGNLLSASARLGCQYQLNKRQYVALVMHDIGRVAQQQVSLEHILLFDERLSFAQGFSWNLQYKPQLYISLSQKLTAAKVQFTCGLFPQSYAISIALSKQKQVTWLLGQSWQSAQGLCFQIGLKLH